MKPWLRAPPTLAVLWCLATAGRAFPAPSVPASCEDGTAHAHFWLESQDYADPCSFVFGTSSLVTVHVMLAAVPATKARFSLPDPPYGVVVGETWNFPHTGSRTTGLELDLGSCLPAAGRLGTLTILVAEPAGECAPWQVDNGCEIEDCRGVVRAGVSWLTHVSGPGRGGDCWCCWQCCQFLPPYALVPVDGATQVAVDATLSWSGTPEDAPPGEPSVSCSVRISTDPACGTGQTITVPCGDRMFAPDFLEPETTYYWQVSWVGDATGSGCSNGLYGESAQYSFTTGPPIAVERHTWGRMKTLYRD